MNISEKSETRSVEDVALEWFVLLQSASMTEQEEKTFFVWLSSDPEHQQAFVEVESLWQRGGALANTIRVGARPKTQNRRHAWFYEVFSFKGVSVGVVACVFAVFVIPLLFTFSGEVENTQYHTSFGEQKIVRLSEGSAITLNANSDIDVRLAATSSRSVILNKGEAFFTVSPDPKRPFTIQTEAGLVVVLGTKFCVSKLNGTTLITVVEGRVGLLPGESSWHGQNSNVILTANQQLELNPKLSEPRMIDADKMLAWRKGQLYFEGDTLLHVVNQLNQYYNSSIILADKSLESKMVVAVFPLENDFEANLKHLKQSLQLSSRVTDDGGILLSHK